MKKRNTRKEARRIAKRTAAARSGSALSPTPRAAPPVSPPPPRRGRPIVRWVAVTVLGAVVLAGAGLALAWMRSSDRPAWWDRAAQLPHDAEARASSLERGLTNTLASDAGTRRPLNDDARRVIPIAYADANAWLRHRLPLWLANQGVELPEVVRSVAIDADPPHLLFGVALDFSGAGSARDEMYLTVAVTPRIGAEGELFMKLEGVRLGRLAIPLSVVRYAIGGDAPVVPLPGSPEDRAVVRAGLNALFEGTALLESETFALADAPPTAIESIEVEAQRLVLTVRTEPTDRGERNTPGPSSTSSVRPPLD